MKTLSPFNKNIKVLFERAKFLTQNLNVHCGLAIICMQNQVDKAVPPEVTNTATETIPQGSRNIVIGGVIIIGLIFLSTTLYRSIYPWFEVDEYPPRKTFRAWADEYPMNWPSDEKLFPPGCGFRWETICTEGQYFDYIGPFLNMYGIS